MLGLKLNHVSKGAPCDNKWNLLALDLQWIITYGTSVDRNINVDRQGDIVDCPVPQFLLKNKDVFLLQTHEADRGINMPVS